MVKKCPDCGSEKLVHDHEKGELICKKCGLIVDENMTD
ncbi:MAG: TFIIB-type zinc ribbon-containing protein, partial [Candidatus Micrarchaeota archaeon]